MARRKRARGSTRYFVLLVGGKEKGVYTGSQPRRAALKAASRGFSEIKLHERGAGRVHIYRGARLKVKAPENKPSWLPAEVWKPRVKKVGLHHLAKKTKARK